MKAIHFALISVIFNLLNQMEYSLSNHHGRTSNALNNKSTFSRLKNVWSSLISCVLIVPLAISTRPISTLFQNLALFEFGVGTRASYLSDSKLARYSVVASDIDEPFLQERDLCASILLKQPAGIRFEMATV